MATKREGKSCSSWLRGLCCPQEGPPPPTPPPGNRDWSPDLAPPHPTHISHRNKGIGQLPNAVLPMEPGQQREA